MGIDVEIKIGLKNKPEEKVIKLLQDRFYKVSRIDGDLLIVNPKTDLFEWDIDDGDSYEMVLSVSSCTRYYNEGYERGPFLDIYSIIVFLLCSLKEYDPVLFYGGDGRCYIPEVTNTDLIKLFEYYVKYGNEPYYNKD